MGFFKRRPPSFSDAVSKTTFVHEWVAGVLEEAGCDGPATEMAREMANTAAEGVVRQGLRAVAEAYSDHEAVRYLEAIDPAGLVDRVDEVYNATIEIATAGRSGPVLRERIKAFNQQIDENFNELRPNYLQYARINFK